MFEELLEVVYRPLVHFVLLYAEKAAHEWPSDPVEWRLSVVLEQVLEEIESREAAAFVVE